jgi:hypothetical protein
MSHPRLRSDNISTLHHAALRSTLGLYPAYDVLISQQRRYARAVEVALSRSDYEHGSPARD